MIEGPSNLTSTLKETPSQTAGPYVHIGLTPTVAGVAMRVADALDVLNGAGERMNLEGVVYDGAGAPVADALLEMYQLDADGAPLWGRAAADFETGLFRFQTVRPADPFVSLLIFARGVNIHLHTRAYLQTDALEADPVLSQMSEDRRSTLIAQPVDANRFRFDIHLQGPKETIFFDV